MRESYELPCDCNHDRNLHDRHGCAAFLGSFAETAHIKKRCSCKWQGGTLLSLVHDRALHPPVNVVAEVRVRERRGAAIGICESPQALELGSSAESVVAALKARLVGKIPSPRDGSPQVLRIVRDIDSESHVWMELLR